MAELEQSCVFCNIVEGKDASSKILESEKVVAFTTLEGGYPIIVTRNHIRDWADPELDEETVKELAIVQRNLVRVVMAVHEDGISIISNNGRAAGQEIPHLHIHIMPRTLGDRLVRFGRSERLERSVLEENALLYRSKLLDLGLI